MAGLPGIGDPGPVCQNLLQIPLPQYTVRTPRRFWKYSQQVSREELKQAYVLHASLDPTFEENAVLIAAQTLSEDPVVNVSRGGGLLSALMLT